MRRALALTLLLILVPWGGHAWAGADGSGAAPPAGELPIPHAPIRVLSDEQLRLPGSGVTRGSGTPADPYVISGWLFVLPTHDAVTRHGAAFDNEAAVLLHGTRAHVVIERNVFVAAAPNYTEPPMSALGPFEATNGTSFALPTETPPGVALVRVQNVTVRHNAFAGVGGYLGAVGVLHALSAEDPSWAAMNNVVARGWPATDREPSASVRIEENTFRGGNRPAIYARNAYVEIVGNDIAMESRNCCLHPGFVEARVLGDGSRIVGNRVVSYGGSGGYGIHVQGVVRTGDTVTISENVIEGGNVEGLKAVAPCCTLGITAGRFVVEGNRIATEYACAWVQALGGEVHRNEISRCADRPFRVHGAFTVGPDNRIHDGWTYQLRDLRDVVVDATARPAAWLQADRLENVTLRGFHLPASTQTPYLRDLANVTIEDSSFRSAAYGGNGVVLAGRDVTVRRVEAAAVAWRSGGSALALALYGPFLLEDVRASGGASAIYAYGVTPGSELRVVRGALDGAAGDGILAVGPALRAELDDVRVTSTPAGVTFRPYDAGELLARNLSFEASSVGIRNPKAWPVDARGSWWGDASGPRAEGNPGGTGASIEGPALYAPWLGAPPP